MKTPMKIGAWFCALCLGGSVFEVAAGAAETEGVRRLVLADESRAKLHYYDTSDPAKCFSIPAVKPVWDLKQVGERRFRTVGGGGFQIFDLQERKVVDTFKHPALNGISAVCDLKDGGFVASVNRGRYPGNCADFVRFNAQREYVATYSSKALYNIRTMELDTDNETLLAAWEKGCMRLKLVEADHSVKVLSDFRQPHGRNSFDYKRARNGKDYLCSCGYHGGVLRVTPENKVLKTLFMPKTKDPKQVERFYAQLQEMPDGSVYAAHWTGHGVKDSYTGWQVIQFAPDGSLRWGLHDPDRLGSVSGVIVLDAPEVERKRPSVPRRVESPDGSNALQMTLTPRGIELAAERHGKLQATVVLERQGYRDAEDAPDGRTCEIDRVETREIKGKVPSPVYKKAEVDLAAKELTVRFKGKWGLVLHARNDGVAYRLFTERAGERFLWCTDAYVEYPSKDTKCWAGVNNGAWKGDKFQNSWESVFEPTTVGKLRPFKEKLYYLPFVTENGGVFTAFTESDLRDYPGVDLVHDGDARRVRFWHAQKPSETKLDRAWQRVLKRRDGFAQVQGTRTYPWRVFVFGDNVADLAAADAVWALAAPADAKADFSWVRPGVTSWEWWNSMDVGKVPFAVGPNTETYKHFIDFSAELGLPYYLMDAGWTVGCDIHKIASCVDLPQVMAHAKAKGVGVILWVSTSQLIGREEAEVAYLASLGAAGLKIDFLDRDDQDAVLYVEKVAAAAAKHHLVIDWHGMYKPTGLERKYPNILNYEGIFGLENTRWDSRKDIPRHDCQATFTRMVAGPMDYTPGGMRNLTRENYKPSGARGQVPTQGTRVHQMALMALYFAPLQMMADGTAAYRANPECARFMAKTPTVWDDTVAIPSEMGKTAALARRKGDIWYLAVIGDWEPRTLEFSTGFLNGGTWRAEAFEDADDADREPTHWKRREFEVRAGESVRVRLAPGGGFIMRLTPQLANSVNLQANL